MERPEGWLMLVLGLLLLGGFAAHAAGARAHIPRVTLLLLLGVVVGLPMAWLTGRVRAGEPTLIEAMGFVFLCGGLAVALQTSYLLACIVLGGVVARWAKHHTRPYHAVKGIAEPFLVVFFVLAGVRFEPGAVAAMGAAGAVYVVMRVAGRLLGGAVGARMAHLPPAVAPHVGWCLLPQAGVALGMALLAAERLPGHRALLLQLVIAATVVFELTGPLLTRHHLGRAGELPGGGVS